MKNKNFATRNPCGCLMRIRRGSISIRRCPTHHAATESLEACKIVKDFLVRLEDGTDMDDPLREIRARVHAPLHAALDCALNKYEEEKRRNEEREKEEQKRQATKAQCQCFVSTNIAEEVNYGTGKLDDYGFWEFPCTHRQRTHVKKEQASRETGNGKVSDGVLHRQ